MDNTSRTSSFLTLHSRDRDTALYYGTVQILSERKYQFVYTLSSHCQLYLTGKSGLYTCIVGFAACTVVKDVALTLQVRKVC
jgi:hypothetical protein